MSHKKHVSELHPSQEFDYGPIFGGRNYEVERPQSTAVDPEERLAWARRALLLSNLETFTAEDVRRFTVEMRPHYIGSGNWIGFTFRCPLFEPINHEHATREEARARWIMRYKLTAEGEDARRKVSQEVRQ